MKIKPQNQPASWLRSTPLLIALGIGGVLLLVYYYGRRSARGGSVSYPASKETDSISKDYAEKIVPGIINEMYEAFDGISMDVDRKTLAIKPLLSVTDNQLVYIFKSYNTRYLSGNESLYTVVDGEYFGPIGEAAATKTKVLKRMRDLKLDR